MKNSILFVICLTNSIVSATDFTKCAFIKCANACEVCMITDASDQAKCVVRPECSRCKDVEVVNCFADPCHQWQQRCPNASHCRSDFCGGCNAHFYNSNWDKIETCQNQEAIDLKISQPASAEQKRMCGQKPREVADSCTNTTGDVFYYDRQMSTCQEVGDCVKLVPDTADTLLLNSFTSLESCENACSSVPPCPMYRPVAPPPGCVYDWTQNLNTTDIESDMYGCYVPVLNCENKMCEKESATCPEGFQCTDNEDGTGFCCTLIEKEEELEQAKLDNGDNNSTVAIL